VLGERIRRGGITDSCVAQSLIDLALGKLDGLRGSDVSRGSDFEIAASAKSTNT